VVDLARLPGWGGGPKRWCTRSGWSAVAEGWLCRDFWLIFGLLVVRDVERSGASRCENG
jgi:hypothetical protein